MKLRPIDFIISSLCLIFLVTGLLWVGGVNKHIIYAQKIGAIARRSTFPVGPPGTYHIVVVKELVVGRLSSMEINVFHKYDTRTGFIWRLEDGYWSRVDMLKQEMLDTAAAIREP